MVLGKVYLVVIRVWEQLVRFCSLLFFCFFLSKIGLSYFYSIRTY